MKTSKILISVLSLQMIFGPALAQEPLKHSKLQSPIGVDFDKTERERIKSIKTQASLTSEVKFDLNQGPTDDQMQPGYFKYHYPNGDIRELTCWRARYLGRIRIIQNGKTIVEENQPIDYVAYQDPISRSFVVRRLFMFVQWRKDGTAFPIFKLQNPQIMDQEPRYANNGADRAVRNGVSAGGARLRVEEPGAPAAEEPSWLEQNKYAVGAAVAVATAIGIILVVRKGRAAELDRSVGSLIPKPIESPVQQAVRSSSKTASRGRVHSTSRTTAAPMRPQEDLFPNFHSSQASLYTPSTEIHHHHTRLADNPSYSSHSSSYDSTPSGSSSSSYDSGSSYTSSSSYDSGSSYSSSSYDSGSSSYDSGSSSSFDSGSSWIIPLPLAGGGLAAAAAAAKGAKSQKQADQNRQLGVSVDPSGPIE